MKFYKPFIIQVLGQLTLTGVLLNLPINGRNLYWYTPGMFLILALCYFGLGDEDEN